MIYFVESGPDGPIKIGFAEVDVAARIGTLQVGNPVRLNLLHVCDGDRLLEKQLHGVLRHSRMRGEWFRPTPHVKEVLAAALAGEDMVIAAKPREFPDFAKWMAEGIARMAKLVGPTKLALIVGVTPKTIHNWAKQKAAPPGDQFFYLLNNYPDFFGKMPAEAVRRELGA